MQFTQKDITRFKKLSFYIFVALVCIGITVIIISQIAFWKDESKEESTSGFMNAITYFVAAMVVFILRFTLPYLKSFSAGDYKFEFHANLETENKVGIGGGKNSSHEEIHKVKKKFENLNLKPEYDSNDPQKGMWGGKKENNGLKLSASVTETENPDLFKLKLKVEPVKNRNLTGTVIFHLHDTFNDMNPEIYVRDNKAELNLIVYGAFTVGAEADNGRTQLELDLDKDMPLAPSKFKER